MPRRLCWTTLSMLLVGCGVDGSGFHPRRDAGVDADRPDAMHTPQTPMDAAMADNGIMVPKGACGATGARPLSQARAEIVLVVDRSGSMNESGTDGRRKWESLRESLRAVLPQVQSVISMGLVAYPNATGSSPGLPPEMCGVMAQPDVGSRFDNAGAVLQVLDTASPQGGTPTYAALQLAARYYTAAPDITGRRYLVLATDGGPNCDPSARADGCRCTSADPSDCDPSIRGDGARYTCLDAERPVGLIRELSEMGIRTFVIGLPGVESFADVMNAMANAGGVPRAGTTRYYDASSRDALTEAFRTITSGLVTCRFQIDESPPDPNWVEVRLGDRVLPPDRTHRDGWDWTDPHHREILFYGSACESVRSAGGRGLVIVFGCRPPV